MACPTMSYAQVGHHYDIVGLDGGVTLAANLRAYR